VKKTLKATLQLTDTDISFCYGEKEYIRFMKKEYRCDEFLNNDAVTTIVTNNNTGKFSIVIGIKKIDNIYSLKGLIVHEISHSVTEWMKEFGLNCDEVRSYTVQYLYQEIIPFVDKIISKKND